MRMLESVCACRHRVSDFRLTPPPRLEEGWFVTVRDTVVAASTTTRSYLDRMDPTWGHQFGRVFEELGLRHMIDFENEGAQGVDLCGTSINYLPCLVLLCVVLV